MKNDYLAQFNKATATVNEQVLREASILIGKPVERFSQEDVIRYAESISGSAPNTIRRKLNTISGFFNYIIKRGLAKSNPVVAVRIPRSDRVRSIRWLNDEDVDLLVSRKYDTITTAVLQAGLSGLRLSEIASLNVEHYGNGRLWNVVGKGNKVRTVPLTIQAARAIEDCIGDRTSGPLLSLRGGRRISTRSIQNRVSEAASEALGRHVNVHALRHTFMTQLAKADVPIAKMAMLAGHSNPSVTMIYTHLDDNDLADEVRKLDREVTPSLRVVAAQEVVA